MAYHYTKNLQKIIEIARREAIQLGQNYIGTDHLLLGIIKNNECTAYYILGHLGIAMNHLDSIITDQLKRISGVVTLGHLPFTKRAERVLKMTYMESRSIGNTYLGSAHLLLAIAKETDGSTAELLQANDVQYDDIKQELYNLRHSNNEPGEVNESNSEEMIKDAQSPLEQFGQDFTKLAAENKLDPVIGRDEEIMRVAQILCRRKKNNPVLIGEPGVGKTAIVEGLALRIINKEIPRTLYNKRIINLDLGNLVAGTKFRGQFEERIKALIDDLKKRDDIIIFIDELHTIVGAGSAQGSLDAANLFKPALARGDIHCIGATTYNEYRKNIEKDGALERRFQKVTVNPPSVEETYLILNALKDRYELHHRVRYSDEAVKACVNLSERYITDKHLPDKAFDLLDEAGARVHLEHLDIPLPVIELEEKISQLTKEKESAIIAQNFEKAAHFRDEEIIAKNELSILNQQWENEESPASTQVTENDIAQIIGQITGIPVHRMIESEREKYLQMDKVLQSVIIGQDKAITKLAQSIRRARAGLKDPQRPVGSFLFLGPTGVGKTETARQIAKYLFQNANALIKIDMSEYMERFAVSRLIGAPPGYIGHEDGGMLTEAVRKHPYSVVLFDEIEKAHEDVFNILLQILDEGILTDTLGRVIDFKNTIIIITSNSGNQLEKQTDIGFNTSPDKTNQWQQQLIAFAKKLFNPEFINRLDDIIVFNHLDRDNIRMIINQQINKLSERVCGQGDCITVSDKALDQLVIASFNADYGAREVRRIIQNEIEDKIAEMILKQELNVRSPIHLEYEKNQFNFMNQKNIPALLHK